MCGVASEDGFRGAKFAGGKNKPSVVAPLGRLCDNPSKYGLYNQCGISVSTIAPTSHDTAKFGGLQSPILVLEYDSKEDLIICIRKFSWVKGPRADDGSPAFDKLRIGR